MLFRFLAYLFVVGVLLSAHSTFALSPGENKFFSDKKQLLEMAESVIMESEKDGLVGQIKRANGSYQVGTKVPDQKDTADKFSWLFTVHAAMLFDSMNAQSKDENSSLKKQIVQALAKGFQNFGIPENERTAFMEKTVSLLTTAERKIIDEMNDEEETDKATGRGPNIFGLRIGMPWQEAVKMAKSYAAKNNMTVKTPKQNVGLLCEVYKNSFKLFSITAYKDTVLGLDFTPYAFNYQTFNENNIPKLLSKYNLPDVERINKFTFQGVNINEDYIVKFVFPRNGIPIFTIAASGTK